MERNSAGLSIDSPCFQATSLSYLGLGAVTYNDGPVHSGSEAIQRKT